VRTISLAVTVVLFLAAGCRSPEPPGLPDPETRGPQIRALGPETGPSHEARVAPSPAPAPRIAGEMGPPTPPPEGLAPLAGGVPLAPETWAAALAGRSPEVVEALARLYRAAGMATVFLGTPYGQEPVEALCEWLGAMTELGLSASEIGLDRVAELSRGGCGWRMARGETPGPGDPLRRAAPRGTPWAPPVVQFACDRVTGPVGDVDLALGAAALTAAAHLCAAGGCGDDPLAGLVARWAGPEKLLADLDGLLPRSERFWLKLVAFRRIAGPWSHGSFPVVSPGKPLTRGQHGPRVVQLRRRLAAEGYLPAEKAGGRVYDRDVRDAVRAWREAHGLRSSGTVDRHALALLTRPAEDLLADLAASLRRSLQRGWDRHGTYVLVNIPEARVALFVEGRRAATYRAVVGFPYQEPGGRTPETDAILSYVDLNPTWTPTPYVVSHELEPRARKDPGYWTREHFSRNGTRWVQAPGPWNTLGQVVLAWPNEQNIVLHGTNEPKAFSYQDRALSHGCVRVERIEDLAARILALTGQEPAGGLEPVLKGLQERRVVLSREVRFQMIYDRIAITEGAAVARAPDVYRLDGKGGPPETVLAPLLGALAEARRARSLASR